MNPPISKERIRIHFTYHWWKYILIGVAAFFFWNLLYTTTHYRSPENKRIDWYYQDMFTAEAEKNAVDWMNRQKDTILEDVEECTLTQTGTDATYGVVQLTTWMAAGQGDLYQLTAEQFKSLTENGVFINLAPYIEQGLLQVDGLKLLECTYEDGTKGPCGIYGDALTGLTELGLHGDGMILGILVNCGNELNTVKLLNQLISDMRTEVPADTAK